MNTSINILMETQDKTITYLGKTVIIKQYLSESDEQFNNKLEIIKKLELNNVEWKEANKLVKIWYNIKYKKCRYPYELYNKVINL
jgi:hypothetical protein